MANIWWPVAEGLMYATNVFAILLFVWVVFINFIVDETHQPIDFYSNKMRTRPYWLVVEFLVLGGVMFGVYYSEVTKHLNETLPEVAIALYAQCLLIGLVVLIQESASASMTALVLYAFLGPTVVVIVLIPTIEFKRPGAYYAGFFLIANIVIALWVRIAARRHTTLDGGEKLLPNGAERLFKFWATAVFRWNPLVLLLTSMVYVVVHLYDSDNYGMACAIAYYILASLLVFGCCKSFHDGTEL